MSTILWGGLPFWSWVAENALRFGIGTIVGASLTYVWARRKISSAWHEHRTTQRLIADRLDTTTPGGLGDLVGRDAR